MDLPKPNLKMKKKGQITKFLDMDLSELARVVKFLEGSVAGSGSRRL